MKPSKPSYSWNGDIKHSTPLTAIGEFDFSIPDHGRSGSDQGFETAVKSLKNTRSQDESFLCHHAFPAGISEGQIREVLACHTVDYARALLAQISQVAYHLCRQSIAGITSAAHMSGLLRSRALPILDQVRYSCAWAERQMRRWWSRGMSATTFRRIREELAGWGCFTVDRVAPGSTRKITALSAVNLPALLKVAALAFQRISSESDGWDRFIPGHRCGFLAALWGNYFSGTFYAPDSDSTDRATVADLALKKAAQAKAIALAREHEWSDYLRDRYLADSQALAQQIANLQARFVGEVGYG